MVVTSAMLGALAGTAFAQQPFTEGSEVAVAIEVLRVREAPGVTSTHVGSQRRGDRGVIVDASPHWADGYWWWLIAFRDGTVGWSADGDSDLSYLEPVQSASSEAGTQQRWLSPAPGRVDGFAEAALVERAFWSGTLTLSCAEWPRSDLFVVDRLPLSDHCDSPMTSERDVNDEFLLWSMSADRSTSAGATYVATVRTAGGTLVAASYFNTFETGVRGVQRMKIYRLVGDDLHLVASVHSERGWFHFLDAGGVAHIVSPSGDRVFESHGGDFVLNPALSYRTDDLERLRRDGPVPNRLAQRQNAVRRMAVIEGIALGGPPRERSFYDWVTVFFTGDLMVDCAYPSMRWDAGARFDLATTRCLEPVYAADLPAFEDVHLESVIIAGTVNLAVAKRTSLWLGDHLITFLAFHDAKACDPVFPCRLLVYHHAPDGYEGLLGILSAEANVTWFSVSVTDSGATIVAEEQIYVPGDEEWASMGIEQTYALTRSGIELVSRETVIAPGSHLDRLLSGEARSLGGTTEDVNRAVNEIVGVALAPGLSTEQRLERVTELQSSWSAELLATAVRFVPVYDDRTGSWQSFDTWSRDQVAGSGSDAPFAQDPVGSTVRMLFDPSVPNISRQLGIELGW